MTRTAAMLVLFASMILATSALAQPPAEWSLEQNVPEPFCNEEGSAGTVIQFGVAELSRVTIEVLDASMTSVVRVLVDGYLAPGMHTVAWDGLDSLGERVPEGAYPYRMTAIRDQVVFMDVKVAHVSCSTPASPDEWGAIKALFR